MHGHQRHAGADDGRVIVGGIQKEMDRRDGQKGQDPGQIQANIPMCAVGSRHDVLLMVENVRFRVKDLSDGGEGLADIHAAQGGGYLAVQQKLYLPDTTAEHREFTKPCTMRCCSVSSSGIRY